MEGLSFQVGWQTNFLKQYRRGYPLETCLRLSNVGMDKYLNARGTDPHFDKICVQIEEGED
jgi:hypothetical protein